MSAPLNQSAFARLAGCTRQNVSASVRDGLLKKNDAGLLDPDQPDNKHWLETRHVIESVPSTKRGPKSTRAPVETPAEKKTPVKNAGKKNRDEHIGSAKDENEKGKKDEPLAAQKIRLEVEKLREQRDKLKIENQKARAELVDRDIFANAVFGYLIALNKNAMDMPLSYVDEFESAMKTGKSKTELTDILRKPFMIAIKDTIDQVKRELNNYTKYVKVHAKESEDEE